MAALKIIPQKFSFENQLLLMETEKLYHMELIYT